jgi:electron transfer flavoprotein beta subunit
MSAKKKTIENMDLSALAISVENAWSVVIDSALRPPRAAGVTVTDDGTGAEQLVSYLVEKKLI